MAKGSREPRMPRPLLKIRIANFPRECQWRRIVRRFCPLSTKDDADQAIKLPGGRYQKCSRVMSRAPNVETTLFDSFGIVFDVDRNSRRSYEANYCDHHLHLK